MTVAMGPKGSNLVLGGKLSELSAEQAYTVSLMQVVPLKLMKQLPFSGAHYSCIWPWSRV